MKKIVFQGLVLAGTVMFLSACKPDIEGEIGAPRDVYKGMHGDWELTRFIQQDPNNPVLEERDLSEFYISDGVEPMKLNLNTDDQTYGVTITQGKNFFGEGGTWDVDNREAPSEVYLYSATDTVTLILGSMVLPYSTEMTLEYERSCSDGFKHSVYKFNFKRSE
jgi:hypothetical protein